ncbi:DUF5776 domain-containing protein [Levilactobacillus fuyuanensis]|uniref:DUF5776 domain-containing protein n=1 Tax=Levilactobacillus fuyuanensis TaxID=2486022 RepID=A0ABW4H4V2_9LACO|nr:DUF5776 domain-containing protein [Levilactobacillus fuyuanensis]
MKWKFGLIILGVAIGLSPLFGYENSLPNPEASHNSTVALADSPTNSDYSGTLGSQADGTLVQWELKDGTLTLGGGTLPIVSGPIINTMQGQLLYNLKKTAIVSDGTSPANINFAGLITKINISSKLTVQDATPSASYLFANLTNVTQYTNLQNLDLSHLSNTASLTSMFAANNALTTIVLPSFNLSPNATIDISNMFNRDASLASVDLSNLIGPNNSVSSVSGLFNNNPELREVNLANFSFTANSNYADLFTGSPQIAKITLPSSLILAQDTTDPDWGTINPGVHLTGPSPTADLTGLWQTIGTGKVDFINNDPTNGYLNNNPLGDTTYTNDALYDLYDGTHTAELPANETYVWQPTEEARLIAPDPVTPPLPSIPAPTEPDTATFQPFAVTATKKIGFYSSKDFSATSRLAWFVQKPQLKQPTFIVIGTAKSTAGNARYQVRDTNRGSATYGQTGYITTQSAYITQTYYESAPEVVTVINPGGINGYDSATLKQPRTAYKQGTQLAVKKVVTHNTTTRFLLTNGKYISANKHFVTAGQYKVPAKVQAKTAVNRYSTVNLTQKNKHYPKKTHAIFKVLGWDYSRGTSTTTAGTLRYRVAGGYITANSKYVKALN